MQAFDAGLEKRRAGDNDGAMDLYKKALDQEPGMIPALHNVSNIYLEKNDLENARVNIDKWLGLEPENPKALGLKARLSYREGKFEDAATLLEKALALEKDPQEKERYSRNLASALARLDRQDLSAGPQVMRIRRGTPLEEASKLLMDGEEEKAVEILEKLFPTLKDPQDKEQMVDRHRSQGLHLLPVLFGQDRQKRAKPREAIEQVSQEQAECAPLGAVLLRQVGAPVEGACRNPSDQMVQTLDLFEDFFQDDL